VTNLPAIGGGGGGGAGELWRKWDGLTTSLFEATPALLPAGWSAATISVVADPAKPSGAVLRFQVTADATQETMFWLLAGTPPWSGGDGDNRSFEMEFETTQPSGNQGAGPAILCDDSGSFHGYSTVLLAPTGIGSRIDAGVETFNSLGFGVTSGGPGLFRHLVVAGKQPAADPSFIMNLDNPGQTAARRVTQTIVAGVPPASWDALACDRIGLAFHSNGVGTHTFDLDSFNVRIIEEAA